MQMRLNFHRIGNFSKIFTGSNNMKIKISPCSVYMMIPPDHRFSPNFSPDQENFGTFSLDKSPVRQGVLFTFQYYQYNQKRLVPIKSYF